MPQSSSINNEYCVVSHVEEKILLFKALNALAPLMKILSLGLIVLAWIKNYYIFIFAAALWSGSVAVNYFKWKLNFSFTASVKGERFSLIKRYDIIKNAVLADNLIMDIEFCDIILPDEVKETDIRCFSVSVLPYLILRIKIKSYSDVFCIGADRYLYSLLKNPGLELSEEKI